MWRTSHWRVPIERTSPPVQAGGGFDHGMEVWQPGDEGVGESGHLCLGHAVVTVGIALSRLRGLGMPVLFAVQVCHGVHEQLGAGQFHQSAGHTVVVDMGVGDDDPCDVVEHVSSRVERVTQCGQPVVGFARMPHAAVHQGHGVAVFDDVDVDALDVVDTDGHRGQSDAVGLDLATQFWRGRRHRIRLTHASARGA